jgi:hypothetical protein
MSQSDYIQRKKMSTRLAGITKTPINKADFPNVLSSQDYTSFSEYQIANTILNKKLTPNEMVAPNHQIIFNMEVLATNNCPSFVLCRNTNNRQNRVLQSGFIMQNGDPLTVPIEKYIKRGANASNCTTRNHSCNKKSPCCNIKLLRTMPLYA